MSPLIDQDPPPVVAKANALGLDIIALTREDRVAFSDGCWERIAWVRASKRFILWDVRTMRGAGNTLPRGYSDLKLKPTDIVADVGAFIGHFSLVCARAGVKLVKAYEPSPAAWRILVRNAGLYPRIIEANNVAVVENDQPRIIFNVATDGPGTSNSIVSAPRRFKCINVEAVNYKKAVKDATVIKLDVEGYEFSLPIFPVAKSVRAIFISFHTHRTTSAWKKAGEIRAQLLDEGFRPRTDIDLDSQSIFMHEGLYVR